MKHMKIGARLAVGFAVVLAMMLATSASGVWRLQQTTSPLEQLPVCPRKGSREPCQPTICVRPGGCSSNDVFADLGGNRFLGSLFRDRFGSPLDIPA